MLNENAKKWVKALRSGKYKQGDGGALRAGDRFCCLGVACELFMKDNPGKIIVEKESKYHNWLYDGNESELPEKVRLWLGLRTGSGGFIKPEKGFYHLTTLNDVGVSFKEIAEFIESEPKGLFFRKRGVVSLLYYGIKSVL